MVSCASWCVNGGKVLLCEAHLKWRDIFISKLHITETIHIHNSLLSLCLSPSTKEKMCRYLIPHHTFWNSILSSSYEHSLPQARASLELGLSNIDERSSATLRSSPITSIYIQYIIYQSASRIDSCDGFLSHNGWFGGSTVLDCILKRPLCRVLIAWGAL